MKLYKGATEVGFYKEINSNIFKLKVFCMNLIIKKLS